MGVETDSTVGSSEPLDLTDEERRCGDEHMNVGGTGGQRLTRLGDRLGQLTALAEPVGKRHARLSILRVELDGVAKSAPAFAKAVA